MASRRARTPTRKQQEAYRLYREGLSAREIAQRVGCCPDTVRNRHSRSRPDPELTAVHRAYLGAFDRHLRAELVTDAGRARWEMHRLLDLMELDEPGY